MSLFKVQSDQMIQNFDDVSPLAMSVHIFSFICFKNFGQIVWSHVLARSDCKSSTCWGDHEPGWPVVTQGRAITKVTDNASFQYANHLEDCLHVYYIPFIVESTKSTYLEMYINLSRVMCQLSPNQWQSDSSVTKQAKASSYIAQYPVLRTAQSTLHFTSLTDLFTQTPSRLLWEASSHMLQLMHEGCLYTYPPLSVARYSLIQLSELEQCRMKKRAQGFNTAAQDSNPGFCSRESKALPLSHGTLHDVTSRRHQSYSSSGDTNV